MKSTRGFTLLETLLYIGIFAIVGGSLFGILTNVVRVSTTQVSNDEVTSQLQFAMETVTRLVRDSSAIEIATTTATTTLKLRMADPLKDPTCISLSGGVLKLSQGPDAFQPQNCTATTTDITTDKVVVDSAFFKRIEFPGGHDQVAVDLQFSNLGTGAGKISRALRSGISRVSAATFDSDLLPSTDNNYEIGFSGTKRWKNISVSNVLNLGVITSDPTGIDGSIYYNSTSDKFRGKANGAWADLGSSLWLESGANMSSNVTGNVGIGIANPNKGKLSVQSTDGSTAYGNQIGAVAGGTAQGQRAVYSLYPTFQGTADNGPRRAVDIVGGYNGGAWGNEYLAFNVGGGNDAGILTTERMRIAGNGNVGIGIASPAYKLDVSGDINLGGNLGVASSTPSTDRAINIGKTYSNATGYGIVNTIIATGTLTAARSNYGIYNTLSSTADNTSFANTLYAAYNLVSNTNGTGYNTAYGAYNRVTNSDTSLINATTYGGYNYINNATTGTLTNAYGNYGLVINESAGAITTARGLYGQARNDEGTIGTARGLEAVANQNVAGGTITNATGGYFDVNNTAGTITTGYGVYIASIAGTTNYGIYQSDSTNKNYFAGNVGIGTASPGQKLSVAGTIESTPGGGGFKFPDGTMQASSADEEVFCSLDIGTTPCSGGPPTQVPKGMYYLELFEPSGESHICSMQKMITNTVTPIITFNTCAGFNWRYNDSNYRLQSSPDFFTWTNLGATWQWAIYLNRIP